MSIQFAPDAWEDYLYWQTTDKQMLKKINKLIKEITRTPYEGNGKPELLRYQTNELWSRRINLEHRLLYRVVDGTVEIIQCRYHY